MADVELVIKISEDMYKDAKARDTGHYSMYDFSSVVANGTPLTKGHGELKDANAMINKLCTHEASELFGSTTCAEILDFINDENPIIEADKAESEG